jgi:hypothetical protein
MSQAAKAQEPTMEEILPAVDAYNQLILRNNQA